MLTEKPKAIVITVRDRKGNKSRSLTVYDADLDEVYKKIENSIKK